MKNEADENRIARFYRYLRNTNTVSNIIIIKMKIYNLSAVS